MILADATTGGYIAGNIAAIVIGAICVLVMIGAILTTRDSYDAGLGWGIAVTSFVCLLLTAVVYVWATWPFAYEYHHWIDKKVHVAASSSRLLTDGDGNINQKFVVRDERGTFYGINDTRGALVKEGDTVSLRCKRAYDYGVPRSSHGWDCKWNGRTL